LFRMKGIIMLPIPPPDTTLHSYWLRWSISFFQVKVPGGFCVTLTAFKVHLQVVKTFCKFVSKMGNIYSCDQRSTP
jgi:hypothetical protein